MVCRRRRDELVLRLELLRKISSQPKMWVLVYAHWDHSRLWSSELFQLRKKNVTSLNKCGLVQPELAFSVYRLDHVQSDCSSKGEGQVLDPVLLGLPVDVALLSVESES